MDPIKRPTRYHEMTDPQARPRYTGIADLLPRPRRRALAEIDIGVIGVPFDGGVTNRTGARHGPRAVRDQSTLLRRHQPATGVAPFDIARVRDLGDCWIEQPVRRWKAHWRRSPRSTRTCIDAGRWCRCRSAATIRSACRSCGRSAAERPVGMVHIDAHCDTGDDYLGSRFHHGAPFRRAVEEGLLDPQRVIQIGIRGTTNDPDMWGFSSRSRHARACHGGVRTIRAGARRGRGGAARGRRRTDLPDVRHRQPRSRRRRPAPARRRPAA